MVKQKIVMKLLMEDSKKRSKALSSVVESDGIISVSVDGEEIVVEGDGTDPINLARTLRKRIGFADLVSVAPVEEKKQEKKEEKEESGSMQPVAWQCPIQVAPGYVQTYGYHYEPSCNIL